MKRYGVLIGGVLGGLSAFVLAVLSELVGGITGLPGVAFSLFDWMTRHLPGPLISIFIGTMVKTISLFHLGPTALVAKQLEQMSAVVLFTGIGGIVGALLTAAARQPERLAVYGAGVGTIILIVWVPILLSLGLRATNLLMEIFWLGVLLIGWGLVLGRLIGYLAWTREAGVVDPGRRKFLYLVGAGSFTVLVSAAGISLAGASQSIPKTGSSEIKPEGIANAGTTNGPAQSPPRAALAARFSPVEGTRPELTDNADFYRIDINTEPPIVDMKQWKLDIKGLVNRPMQLTLDEIRARPAFSQVVTLECISNVVGGDLTSTSLWTGIRLKDLLADAGVKEGAKEIFMTADDGFYESVPISEAMDERTLLVYQMNGKPLPVEHGFPLRIYIPNHFGMKQPKWITSLELIDHEASGYWVDRGWNQKAIPPTTSVIDAIDAQAFDPKTGLVPVGGIAYAGARGISKVEVSVDNGPWAAAELRTPPLSPLTWVQWRYIWKATPGVHTLLVRAYDGAGQPQIEGYAPPDPDGATGIYSKMATISK